jgi:hypothetical protein
VVLAGLSPKQEVVVAGTHVLAENQKVRRFGEAPGSKAAAATPAASKAVSQ